MIEKILNEIPDEEILSHIHATVDKAFDSFLEKNSTIASFMNDAMRGSIKKMLADEVAKGWPEIRAGIESKISSKFTKKKLLKFLIETYWLEISAVLLLTGALGFLIGKFF